MNAIELIQLNSVSTGAILLGGLFFYDVFWVFGTNVMVSVARNFEAPVKRIFFHIPSFSSPPPPPPLQYALLFHTLFLEASRKSSKVHTDCKFFDESAFLRDNCIHLSRIDHDIRIDR